MKKPENPYRYCPPCQESRLCGRNSSGACEELADCHDIKCAWQEGCNAMYEIALHCLAECKKEKEILSRHIGDLDGSNLDEIMTAKLELVIQHEAAIDRLTGHIKELEQCLAECDKENNVLDAAITEYEEEILEKDQRIKELEDENMCDVCAGEGKPLNDRQCMCGGSGKMSDAAFYLRIELNKAESKIVELEQQIHNLNRLNARKG